MVWDNFPNKTNQKKKVNQNNKNKGISVPSRAGPALSTNTEAPGGQCEGPTAAAAWKVARPFSQHHSTTDHPLHCSAKPPHSGETTITGGLELEPES